MKLAIGVVIALALAANVKNIMKRYNTNRPVGDPSRIVNGNTAAPHQFPYHAYYEDGPYICGASIIEPNVALTAAHCCDGVAVTEMTIDAGGIDRVTLEGMQRIGVQEAIIHKGYVPSTYENDVCLLLLEENFDFSDGSVGAIRLAPFNQNSDHYTGQTCTITGWGALYYEGPSPQYLQYAEVIVWSDERKIMAFTHCNHSLYALGGEITGDMICAADNNLELHIDSCQGDSGGPMALGDANTPWEDREQVGIVSWGHKCAVNGFPGVYADVAYLRDWIDANNPARR